MVKKSIWVFSRHKRSFRSVDEVHRELYDMVHGLGIAVMKGSALLKSPEILRALENHTASCGNSTLLRSWLNFFRPAAHRKMSWPTEQSSN